MGYSYLHFNCVKKNIAEAEKSPKHLEVELLEAQFQLEQYKKQLRKMECAQSWLTCPQKLIQML